MSAKKKLVKKKLVKKLIKKSKASAKKSSSIKKIIKKKPISKKPKPVAKKISKPKAVVKKPAKKAKKIIAKPLIKTIEKKVKAVKEKKVLVNNNIQENIEKAVSTKRPRKSSKKPLITLPPPPKIEVSTYPKNKVKSVLISQPKPLDGDKNPYLDLGKKYNLNITFRQFIKIEGLNSQDFRAQRIDILEHGAVILTSRLSVDHYFRLCNEMRITVPESMKYFCINEQTAYYLQKYIQYRKRKIFFGHGTILDLVDVIRKNKDEKFLLPSSDVTKEQIMDFLDELKITYTKGIFYKTVSANLSDIKSLSEFDMLVFFTPAGIKSLKQNFPGFKQGNTRIAAFGHAAALLMKDLGFRLDVFAPNPQNPSMSGAIDSYLKEANKR
ncbi:uroporphyrinogen-III synthase [Sediminibacterium sp.]|uniref:uroporphyrinogen-III synthase n=1 Tax=Sediminibacterium sp. TaxID=1917865 RepID=UPI0027335F22|nr:uroporphyrinogen-III synthase [Sediminibacterium sp.]MDP3567442.1 uroporphyrinogen-III synthase [Sediminibacterium sp.]